MNTSCGLEIIFDDCCKLDRFFFNNFFVTLRRRKHHDRCNKGLSFGKSRVE